MTEDIRNDVPEYSDLINPTLSSLRFLGGSGTVGEIKSRVIEELQISNAVADVQHDERLSNQTELEYQLTRARIYLRRAGLIKNSSDDIWVIKPEYRSIKNVDAGEVIDRARSQSDVERETVRKNLIQAGERSGADDEERSWRSELRTVLTEQLSPSAFERLTQRLLREIGFREVEVTGRSGDGGLDGRGLMKINGILSFHVVFQCKRYTGTVSSGEVRDFRGAMAGRADRGLFLTTGSFSREAKQETTRDGVKPIDLVDGSLLADKLKNLGLGVETRTVKRIVVNEEWFRKV
ncbi:restriction endonuclease [Salinibacter ruber]|uniref:restriction endonuclease n=1 Tax=Salinibacter ruber TaxID=146919 RepID=UPI000E57DA6C|nr:restriction endonuclease [Salinibacter ruber]